MHTAVRTLPVSLIVTVLNEAATIASLLDAIEKQTQLPAEMIIVDGGSDDDTIGRINRYQADFPSKLTVVQMKGNRSLGRNTAISMAKYPIIACTDAGCLPKPSWLAELYKCYKETNSPVIAGYYIGHATTPFEAAVIPYALVMPDRVDEATFLPATRSMLFEKKVWQLVGGFDVMLSDNEDYAFAHTLKANGVQIRFARAAVVLWQPRSTLMSFYWMIFRFARGDIQALIIRPKVVLVFARYVIGVLCLAIGIAYAATTVIPLSICIVCCYVLWATLKNSKYVKSGWWWLPVLQFAADVAVMHGSIAGLFRITSFSNSKNDQ